MTAPAPMRITTVQYLRAAAATRLGLDTHPGADDNWSPLAALRDEPATSRPDLTATALITPIRRPAAALAAVAYRPVVDEHLGVLIVGPLEPARIADHLAAGGTR
ncbi:hypothetical protein [Micromonospora sp. NPDC023644]|uniref:hypothetical protein n=1 Tax=Micromonospora sp. NPDC023644 TaxID=3154321 RepID=UPI0033ECFCDE